MRSMRDFLLIVLAIALALVFRPTSLPVASSIVSHVNGFAPGRRSPAVSSLFRSEQCIERSMANDKQNPQQASNHTFEGKRYDRLEDAILAVAKQSCRGIASWHWHDPFYPDHDDLTGLALVKLYTYTRPTLENIWNNPDPDTGGYVGLLRFAWKVAKAAAIDERRRNTSRAPEVLALRLDEPIRNDDETGTRADLVSDQDGSFQAFQFDDLRDQLTQEEFEVVRGIVADCATEQELAQEFGTSDSAISRTYVRAKDKAAKWVRWLKERSDKQTRASIYPTFTRRSCLRPNGIAPETLGRWNDGLSVVEFHDESAAWHPRITKQPRVRAKRECWNAACQSGAAIGADNLVLPAARRIEAVRFLPAYTGQDNRVCAGCQQALALATQGAQFVRVPRQGSAARQNAFALTGHFTRTNHILATHSLQ